MNKVDVRQRSRMPFAVNSLAFVTSSILATSARGSDDPARTIPLEEVIVTAQKRSEDLQSVPISVQVLDNNKLVDLHITSFDDYLKYLPSLSARNDGGPGHEQPFIRGVTNGSGGLSVGSQPTVAVYLDEQPVTTIEENLDVHIYDIARVEELSGPQGTLFGASSMAGTLRIITNKPSTAGFEAGYHLDANTVTAWSPGDIVEGYVNLPLSDRAAIRLVGFTEHDGGYINNVLGPPEIYPTSGVVRTNAALVKSHFNDITTSGGRAALKVDLDKSWTVTPTVMAQHQTANGVPGYEPSLGDLNVARYFPESNVDHWWQAALSVEGKISNFDLVYAGSYLRRAVDNFSDYSDYTFDYDVAYATMPQYFGDLYRDDAGKLISPAQFIVSSDRFSKVSHELRLSTPKDWRLRFVAGLFLQHQIDDTRSEIRVQGLARIYSITGEPGVLYLNAMSRVDRDKAAFGEFSFDFTKKLTLTGGLREFAYDNTVYGFFGYNGLPVFGGGPRASGELLCAPGSAATAGPRRPCIDVDQRAAKSGSTFKLNLTYHLDSDRMLYTTWSTGFRPGGINRTKDAAPYHPDYLANFEAGWKTSWFDHALRFNGAVFFERWKDAQYTVCGTNCVFEVINAGAAQIRGIESELDWAATDALTVSASATWLDAKLTTNACRYGNAGSLCNNSMGVADPGVVPVAPAGTPLPTSKRKGNLIARYKFNVYDSVAHVQVAEVAQSALLGNRPPTAPGYASFDFTTGIQHGSVSTEVYVKNLFDVRGPEARFPPCLLPTCTQLIAIPIVPRTIGISFSQKF